VSSMAPIGIRAAAAWWKSTEDVARAIRVGHLTEEDAHKLDIQQVAVGQGLAGPDLAVEAGQRALLQAGLDPREVGWLFHAWINHQGHDFWSPAHYVANRLGMPTASASGIQQMCNGGAAAIEIASAMHRSDDGAGTAMVTTGDQFAAPGFDRWSSDFGVAYGDAGTAVIVASTPRSTDPLHLLSTQTVTASSLEVVHRGTDQFTSRPRARGPQIDVRRTKRAFLNAFGADELQDVTLDCVRRAVLGAFAQAGVRPDDSKVAAVLLPRLGRRALEGAYLPALSDLKAPTFNPGAATGHLGAGDAIANLAHVVDNDLLQPGQIAVILSGGGGFSWTCLLVQRPSGPQRNPINPSHTSDWRTT